MLSRRQFDIAIKTYRPIYDIQQAIINDKVLVGELWNYYESIGLEIYDWEQMYSLITISIFEDSLSVFKELAQIIDFKESAFPFVTAHYVLSATDQFADPWQTYISFSHGEIEEFGSTMVDILRENNDILGFSFPQHLANINIDYARQVERILETQCDSLLRYTDTFIEEDHNNVRNEFGEERDNQDKEQNEVYIEKPFDKLEELIGLESVKSEVISLSNFIKMRQMREKKGLKTPSISYHCVFTGNPGTGKTTIARLLAGIFKELGILKKGHLVETDRSGLVAEYVGQTAVKTNAIIDKALDGVLFIDEAYSLIQGGQGDFGKEAISTLLKRMEDDRERLIVILAGYDKEMQEFINSNPGLRSRFNRYINFQDYSAEELLKILYSNFSKNEYVLGKGVEKHIREGLKCIVANKEIDFGNARYIRNIFEKTIENQANRLAMENRFDHKSMITIELSDIKDLM